MSGLPLDVLTWQATIASADGPKGYTMRVVLLALAARMLADSQFANRIRITHDEIATASDLSKRWTIMMLEKAETDGWITIGRPIKADRHRMPACEYGIRLPDVPRRTIIADCAKSHG